MSSQFHLPTKEAKCLEDNIIQKMMSQAHLPKEEATCLDDEIIYLPISENIHINNILHKSLVPADINEDSTEQIKDITKKIIRELNYKGII